LVSFGALVIGAEFWFSALDDICDDIKTTNLRKMAQNYIMSEFCGID
jgi:hypothetical protein